MLVGRAKRRKRVTPLSGGWGWRRNLNPAEEEIGGLGEEGRGWLRARAASSPAGRMGKEEGGKKRRNATWWRGAEWGREAVPLSS